MKRLYLAKSPIDFVELSDVVEEVISPKVRPSTFDYIVTPNVDHVVRNFHDSCLQEVYEKSLFSLCDSRVLSFLARAKGYPAFNVIPGSDLTEALFERLRGSDVKLTIIGASRNEVVFLKEEYKLKKINHFNPPMGFIHDEELVRECVQFVENNPADIVILAVGSPQQELLAHQFFLNDNIIGIGLCVGASLRFLVGSEKRAPKFISRIGLEWCYRLINDPKRLWRRYLRDIKIFYIIIFKVNRLK